MWLLRILILGKVVNCLPWGCLSLCDLAQSPTHHTVRYTAPAFDFADFNQRHFESQPALCEITPISHTETFAIWVPDLGGGVGQVVYEFSDDRPSEFRIVPAIDYPVLLSLARTRGQRILEFDIVVQVRHATPASLHAPLAELDRLLGNVWPSLHHANPSSTYLAHEESVPAGAEEGGSHVSHPAVYPIGEAAAGSPATDDRYLHVEWTIRYATLPVTPHRLPIFDRLSSRRGQSPARSPHG